MPRRQAPDRLAAPAVLATAGAVVPVELARAAPALAPSMAPAFPIVAAGLGLLAAAAVGVALVLRRRLRRMAAVRAELVAALDELDARGYAEPLAARVGEADPGLYGAIERMRSRLFGDGARLDTVLDSMQDAVLVTDAAGRIVRANAAAERLLGWSAAELAGRGIESLVAVQEQRQFSLERAVSETREYMLLAAGGAPVPVALSGSRLTAVTAAESPGCIFVGHDITERRRAERRLLYLARNDALTRIPNRLDFQHRLQQAIARARRAGEGLALLYLDLDRFKDVNDTFGHSAGDRTLEILSERLKATAPPGAVLGRLAGDEFALFIEHLPTDGARPILASVARALLDELSRAFFLNETEIYLTGSVGIVPYGEGSDNPIDMIRNGDTAMYHAKQSGGGNYAFYDPDMNAATIERLTLKSKLRRALELDEFVVLYQPKVELGTLRLAGAEALLRWRLPGHGDIPPSVFIPLAEQTGLIQPIGEWVLRRVCSDYRAWQARVHDPGRISINLSLRQLQQASFLARFASVFREYGVDPSRLELEITETTLMSNAPRTVEVLQELRELGIKLSIDDFGTGYSSLSALQHLPVETLKIDQSFVRDAAIDAEDATLVRTIIEMGRNLGLEVVAEGVETRAQLAFLRQLGCHFGQGLLFGQPMDAESLFARMIADAHAATARRPPGLAG